MQASPELRFTMPTDRCCNCGSRLQLEILPLEFPLTRSMPDADRWALVLRTPFCVLCKPSARRRMPGLGTTLVVGLVLTVLCGMLYAHLRPILGLSTNPLVPVAACALAGFGLPFALYRWMPKDRTQSSWWCPVRVQARDAEAAKGQLKRLRIDFTSADYLRAFALANPGALQRPALVVRSVGKAGPEDFGRV